MFTTLYMGLTAWDQGSDPYDHSELSNNFAAIDDHRHIPGEGRQIPTAGLEDKAIKSAKIDDNAVIARTIPNNSIGDAKLTDDSVGRRHLQDDAVGANELASGVVTFDHLASGVMPIGKVIMLYRPNSSFPLPVGWEVLDGRPWNTVPNAWGLTSGNMPDFTNRFPLGAALTGTGSGANQPPDIGQIGGVMEVDLTHQHAVSNHSHTVPDHSHVITVNAGGGHGHTVQGGRNLFFINHGRFDGNYTFRDDATNQHSSAFGVAYVASGLDGLAAIDAVGDHAHAASAGGSGALTTSAATGVTTTNALALTSIKNRYVGVLFLMRVL